MFELHSRKAQIGPKAEPPRRKSLGIALLAAAASLLVFAPAASATLYYQLTNKWGNQGSGDGQFNGPTSVAIDSSGHVYVADGYRIQKFSSSGTFLAKWGSGGSSIAVDSSDNIYVVEPANYRIRKFDSSGNFITQWGSSGSGNGQFTGSPTSIAIDSSNNVYVTDVGNWFYGPQSRILKFDASGNFIASWDTPNRAGELGGHIDPSGLATDSSNNVYFGDPFYGSVDRYSSSGTSNGGVGWDGPRLVQPWAVATDSSDNVYVTDLSYNRIQKYDSSESFVTNWGTMGSGNGQFDRPSGIAVNSSSDYVYVADQNNNRIEVFRAAPQTTINSGPSGVITNDSPSFTFSSSEPGSTFECRLDSTQEADFQSCSSPKTYTSLADGSHTFYVRSTTQTGNTDPTLASRTFTIDTTPPDTTITGGPSGGTNDPTPSFTFSASESGSTFECKVDSGSYAACTSPKTTSHLPDGSHTIYVRATDSYGNVESTPATRTFTVRTAAVYVSGTTVVVAAATGAKDNLSITLPSASVLSVSDSPSGTYKGSGIHVGAGCTRSGDYTANCSGEITQIQVFAADQNDQVVNSTPVSSSPLNGGGGNDVLTGGSTKDTLNGNGGDDALQGMNGSDTLSGDSGADVMKGMNGNDQLFGRDLTNDTTINCDGGIGTPGSADKADLDVLPKDSNVTNCETVTRH